mgnify:CR=1 FL=1
MLPSSTKGGSRRICGRKLFTEALTIGVAVLDHMSKVWPSVPLMTVVVQLLNPVFTAFKSSRTNPRSDRRRSESLQKCRQRTVVLRWGFESAHRLFLFL